MSQESEEKFKYQHESEDVLDAIRRTTRLLHLPTFASKNNSGDIICTSTIYTEPKLDPVIIITSVNNPSTIIIASSKVNHEYTKACIESRKDDIIISGVREMNDESINAQTVVSRDGKISSIIF